MGDEVIVLRLHEVPLDSGRRDVVPARVEPSASLSPNLIYRTTHPHIMYLPPKCAVIHPTAISFPSPHSG